jgi:peptidoglycan/LPS O-acetylase OafA/YrhL
VNKYFAFEKRQYENPWLDLLRTLAVATVILMHGYGALRTPGMPSVGIIANFMNNGWVGVDLFFVLSGFLIASSLIRLQAKSQSVNYKDYLLQRALRILPAYYAVLLLVVVGAFPFYEVSNIGLGGRVFYHVLLLQDYLISNINVVFWSLGVEEKFYLIAPILVGLFALANSPKKFILLCLVLICISPIARYVAYLQVPERPMSPLMFGRFLRTPFHACLDPLIVGVALAAINAMDIKILKTKAAKLALLCLFGVMIVVLGSHNFRSTINLADVIWQPIGIAFLFGAMVYVAVQLQNEKMPFEWFFRIIARLSFTLYLLHYPLIPLSKNLSEAHGGSAIVFWIYFLALSMSASLALHYAVEKPFLILKKRVARKPVAGTA